MDAREIMKKYGRKLDAEIRTDSVSKSYSEFKKELIPELSSYEKWCYSIGNLFSLKVAKKDEEKIQKWLSVSHSEATPSQALALSILALLGTFFVGVLISVAVYLITDSLPVLLFFLFLIFSLFLFYYTYGLPERIAHKWRLKASSQMVPAILYIVIYMKHTSNLERAIYFASEHLSPPLALDFKKIIWDVETGKFATIKESLDSYLETWRDYSVEFIEAFHLIESSLYEPSDSRRIDILEKALTIMLDGIYDKMLKFSHNVRSPLTNLYMLGIVLPTLALALLPLASTLLQGMIKWYHVMVLFDLIVPFFVFYLTSEIMLKRPGGYGETELLELNPNYHKFKSKKPYLIALLICLPILLISAIPFIMQINSLTYVVDNPSDTSALLGLKSDYTFTELGLGFLGDIKIFNFIRDEGKIIAGPFGPVALLLSLFVPLSLALFFSIAFSMKSRELIKAREDSKDLEKEFNSALFQLGNRLGEGIPAEIAFAKVSESTKGTKAESFFKIVNSNIQSFGMSVDQAIFDKRRGAIVYYPSILISTSMKILVESVKKGLKIAANSLISISEYVKSIWKINERLRDLLTEVSSDMSSNMTFLAPLLSGIVIGLTSMITLILSKLEVLLQMGGEGQELAGFSLQSIMTLFNVETMIPPYFLQIAVGIYLIEIVFILTSTLVTVDSGEDKLKNINETAKNLKIGILLYVIVSFIAILALSVLASVALGGMAA